MWLRFIFFVLFILSIQSTLAFLNFFFCALKISIFLAVDLKSFFPHSAFRFHWWVIFNFLPPMPPQAEALSPHPTMWNSLHQPATFPSSHEGIPDHHGRDTEGSEAPG